MVFGPRLCGLGAEKIEVIRYWLFVIYGENSKNIF